MNKTHFLNAIVTVSGNEFFAGMKLYVSLIFRLLAEDRLKYGENGAIDLIFNYWGEIKIVRNFMTVEISAKNFLGIIGGSMGLFETGFRILISVMVISELAVDL